MHRGRVDEGAEPTTVTAEALRQAVPHQAGETFFSSSLSFRRRRFTLPPRNDVTFAVRPPPFFWGRPAPPTIGRWPRTSRSTPAPSAAAPAPNGWANARSCGAWNTLVESVAESAARPASKIARFRRPPNRWRRLWPTSKRPTCERQPTGIDELDRVLGGGIVDGGVVLIGGDPGIGKSTLLLQALDSLSRVKVLYVTGEESGAQVALRSRRLGLGGTPVRVLAEIQLEKIMATLEAEQPAVCVIDSIQTVYSEPLTSAPGSVAQVRECAAQLTRRPRPAARCIVLVGHVTKDGALAGPRVLEHIVDTVLYFEGDTHSSFRLVRAIKNRFGAVNEIGVFAMTEKGPEGRRQPERDLSLDARRAGARLVRAGHARRHAADAGRDAGAGRRRRPEPAAAVGRPRPRPPGDDAGGAAPPCRHRRARPGRVRQRRRRRAHQRAGRRPGGDAGDPVQPARQAPAARLHRLRRGRPGRRSAARAARPGAPARSGQAGLFGRDRAEGECAQGRARRPSRA